MATEKPHLSPSQLESYARCPEAWRRRNIDKEIIPPAIVQLQGRGVHRGAAVNFTQKIESHADLPASDIVDASVAGFEAETAGGYLLSDEELAVGQKKTLAQAKDQTAALAELHATEAAPEYQPVLVEHPVRLNLPNSSHDLYGILDLADDKRRVVDHKTVKRKPSQVDVDSLLQLTYYAAAHRVATGELPSELRIEALIKTITPKRAVITTQRTREDFQALSNRINVVLKAIAAGIFPPATPGAWWCDARYCGYHPTCPYVRHQLVTIDLGKNNVEQKNGG